MGEGKKITILANGKNLTAYIGMLSGMCVIVDALEKAGVSLAGFIHAKAIAQRELADHRATMAKFIYADLANAGYDLQKVGAIGTTFDKDGKAIIQFNLADLVELAERDGS